MSLFTQPQIILEGELWDKTKHLVKTKGTNAVKKVGQHIMANKGKYAAIVGGLGAYAARKPIKSTFTKIANKANAKYTPAKAISDRHQTNFDKLKDNNSRMDYAEKHGESWNKNFDIAKKQGRYKTAANVASYGGAMGAATALGGVAALADKYIPLRPKKKKRGEQDE